MKKLLFVLLIAATVASCTEGVKDGRETRKATAKDSRNPKNEVEENIYRSGDSMMQAFKAKDWATFAKYNHPTMLKMMGGEQSFIDLLSSQMEQIPDSSIKKLDMGKILQVVKTNTDHQCVVEQNMLMEMDGMRVTSTTYLVGESLNGGKSWTFFDASNSEQVKPTDIKPNLSAEIKVPQKKQDVKQM